MINKNRFFVIITIALLATVCGIADTMTLTDKGSWQKMSDTENPNLASQIAEFKRLINENQSGELQKLAEKLKGSNPALSGKDFDHFLRGEIQFADENYLKAVKTYKDFLELYPQSKLYHPVMERLYDIAVLFLNGQKVTRLKIIKTRAYEEAAKIMETIAEKAGNKPIAKRSLITLAQSLEKRGQYLDAYRTWSDITNRWPTSETAQKALLGMARSLHSSYRGYKYNSVNLESARSYYRDFMLRYPLQAKEMRLEEQIELIEEQKAYKDYKIAQYYKRSGDKMAASLYYQAVIDQWPKSSAAQLAKNELRQMREKKPEKKRSLWGWWFNPKEDEKMFIVELPD